MRKYLESIININKYKVFKSCILIKEKREINERVKEYLYVFINEYGVIR